MPKQKTASTPSSSNKPRKVHKNPGSNRPFRMPKPCDHKHQFTHKKHGVIANDTRSGLARIEMPHDPKPNGFGNCTFARCEDHDATCRLCGHFVVGIKRATGPTDEQ